MDIIVQTTIFRVYDDEMEEIMGNRQLRKFALYQLKEYCDMLTDEEIKDEIEICVSEDKKDRIKEIITDFFNFENKYTEENYATKISVKDAIELLKLRCFHVEELKVY